MHQAATIDVSHENIPTTEPEPILLSKEHYEKLKTLLNQLDKGVEIPTAKTAPCSFVQTGNIKALSASKDCLSSIWIIDSGATDHMTSNSNFFSNHTTLSGWPKVKVDDGTLSSIISQGLASITPSLTLQNVLHVPNLSYNLLSVSKITKDFNCFVTFTPSCCVFQDQISGRMIEHGERKGGLYYLNTQWKICDSIPQALITTNNTSKVDQIWLWHKRLRHPPFFVLEKMFPTLFGKTKSHDFHCEVCELAKHHRVPF